MSPPAAGTVRQLQMPPAIDVLVLVAVAAALLLVVLAFFAEDSPNEPSLYERAIRAAVRVWVCRSFANAVARGEMNVAERLATKAFARAERWTGREHVPPDRGRT